MTSTSSATVLTLLAAITAGGCSPAAAPVSTSMKDPSNPAAPEGALVAVAPPPAPAPAPAGAEHGHAHAHGEDGEASEYVCPMHPEVTSKTPGLCPKCNMKLVPKS